MSAPPPLPPSSSQGLPPGPMQPPAPGATPPPKKGLSGCAIAAIVLAVVGVLGIALLGVLAAIAIPQYQEYVMRTRVNAVVLESYQVQFAIDQHLAEYGACPDADAFAGMASEPVESGSGDGALSGRWEWREPLADGHCAFGVVFAKPGHAIDGTTLDFRMDESGAWSCDGGTLPAVYRRLGCNTLTPADAP